MRVEAASYSPLMEVATSWSLTCPAGSRLSCNSASSLVIPLLLPRILWESNLYADVSPRVFPSNPSSCWTTTAIGCQVKAPVST